MYQDGLDPGLEHNAAALKGSQFLCTSRCSIMQENKSSEYIFRLVIFISHFFQFTSPYLSFFNLPDLTKPLLQLQTDTSLFVASAASQMLADTLLLCQSVSPPEARHNTEQEADWKHPTLPVETDQTHSVVVEEVCQYLNKSLLPKATFQLHPSQQVLKLLALLLSRAGPPLRAKLLLTVSDSLEDLVTANYSQLTLPLMDILLAAHR